MGESCIGISSVGARSGRLHGAGAGLTRVRCSRFRQLLLNLQRGSHYLAPVARVTAGHPQRVTSDHRTPSNQNSYGVILSERVWVLGCRVQIRLRSGVYKRKNRKCTRQWLKRLKSYFFFSVSPAEECSCQPGSAATSQDGHVDLVPEFVYEPLNPLDLKPAVIQCPSPCCYGAYRSLLKTLLRCGL